MGADCTMAVEELFGDGWDFMAEFEICRSYELFGHLAGVRDHSVPTIHEPRGLPEDVDEKTKAFIEENCDHSFSWCTLEEALAFFKDIEGFEYNDHGFHCFLKFMGQYHQDETFNVRFVYGFDS